MHECFHRVFANRQTYNYVIIEGRGTVNLEFRVVELCASWIIKMKEVYERAEGKKDTATELITSKDGFMSMNSGP